VPERHSSLRVFLDTNVIISATRLESSRFLHLWQMVNVTLVISPYVVMEMLEHVQGAALLRFERLVQQMERVEDAPAMELPLGVAVVEKDMPVLASAVLSRVDVLLTGDKKHFGHLYGQTVENVAIMPPGLFLEMHADRVRL
jgi:predicted nucleic acid-binding protein